MSKVSFISKVHAVLLKVGFLCTFEAVEAKVKTMSSKSVDETASYILATCEDLL